MRGIAILCLVVGACFARVDSDSNWRSHEDASAELTEALTSEPLETSTEPFDFPETTTFFDAATTFFPHYNPADGTTPVVDYLKNNNRILEAFGTAIPVREVMHILAHSMGEQEDEFLRIINEVREEKLENIELERIEHVQNISELFGAFENFFEMLATPVNSNETAEAEIVLRVAASLHISNSQRQLGQLIRHLANQTTNPRKYMKIFYALLRSLKYKTFPLQKLFKIYSSISPAEQNAIHLLAQSIIRSMGKLEPQEHLYAAASQIFVDLDYNEDKLALANQRASELFTAEYDSADEIIRALQDVIEQFYAAFGIDREFVREEYRALVGSMDYMMRMGATIFKTDIPKAVSHYYETLSDVDATINDIQKNLTEILSNANPFYTQVLMHQVAYFPANALVLNRLLPQDMSDIRVSLIEHSEFRITVNNLF